MPKRFSLTVTKAGESTSFDLDFPDEEWGRIQDYVAKVEHLAELPLVRRDLWGDLQLLSGVGKPLKPDPAALKEGRLLFTEGTITVDTSRFPARDELDGLLYRLRPLILKSEPTFFLRVLKLFSRKAKHPVWAPLKERSTGGNSVMRMQHTKNGVTREIISDESLNNWLNAFEYHHDAHLAASFNEIPAEHMTPEAIRGVMLELIAEKTIAAIRLGQFIDKLREGSGTFRFGKPDAADGEAA